MSARAPSALERAEAHLLGRELFGMRFGLDRMHKLMTVLGMPQRRFAHVHVVGSNGKSSTVRFVASLLERHGLRTGSYTSPHLASFRERIEVAGVPVDADRFVAAIDRAREAATIVERTLEEGEAVTQFELLTAAAYHELAASRVEVAVIEAGLGGRWDATNVIPSRVQVLTGVGLEHTRWLGPTITDIAREKLAVVRDHGTLVVAADLAEEARVEAERAARDHSARLVHAPRRLEGVALRSPGSFQRGNFALAACAAQAILDRPLGQREVHEAAAQTRVPGRVDVLSRQPLVIHDGAHNPAGAQALAAALPELLDAEGVGGPVVLVLSVLEDKDAADMLRALVPVASTFVATRCANPRALSPATLESLAKQIGGAATETVAEPGAAMDRAKALAGPDGAVLATGSIYLIADLARGSADRAASSF